jgi:quercetin dioxygenase-like cupin family protein
MTFGRCSAAIATLFLGTIALSAPTEAQNATEQAEVKTTGADEIKYMPIPFAPGAEFAYLASDGKKSENYTLRIHLKPDAKIPPHTHPDTRMITILSGDLFIGTGARFDPDSAMPVHVGAFFVMPAGVLHWAWAKGGDVTYQESGTGPTGTTLVK